MPSWDEIARIGEEDQTRAGLAHIAQSCAEFRKALVSVGFTAKESFQLTREFLVSLMDHVDEPEEDEEP